MNGILGLWGGVEGGGGEGTVFSDALRLYGGTLTSLPRKLVNKTKSNHNENIPI